MTPRASGTIAELLPAYSGDTVMVLHHLPLLPNASRNAPPQCNAMVPGLQIERLVPNLSITTVTDTPRSPPYLQANSPEDVRFPDGDPREPGIGRRIPIPRDA